MIFITNIVFYITMYMSKIQIAFQFIKQNVELYLKYLSIPEIKMVLGPFVASSALFFRNGQIHGLSPIRQSWYF